jgi:hypothetical protein
LIQWESPDADVRQDLHFLGVEVADPAAYMLEHMVLNWLVLLVYQPKPANTN